MELTAMSTGDIETLLRGQVGIVLGMIIMGVLVYFWIRISMGAMLTALLAKFDEVIASNKETTRATNSMTTTVANLLIASDIKSLQERGRAVIEEIKKTTP